MENKRTDLIDKTTKWDGFRKRRMAIIDKYIQ